MVVFEVQHWMTLEPGVTTTYKANIDMYFRGNVIREETVTLLIIIVIDSTQ